MSTSKELAACGSGGGGGDEVIVKKGARKHLLLCKKMKSVPIRMFVIKYFKCIF